MTLLLSASLVNCFLIITFLLTGLLRWENFTSTLGFYFSHKISYEVAWFTVTSFRRTPICFSSEKHFKCEFKISDSLFHQTSPRMKNVRPGVLMKSVCNFSLKSVLVTHLGVWLRKKLSVILLTWSKSVLVVITRDLMKQSSVYQELALVLEFCL